MKEVKKLRATLSLDQDEMIILRGGNDPHYDHLYDTGRCFVTSCGCDTTCASINNTGFTRGYLNTASN
jgi:hypothetical protein